MKAIHVVVLLVVALGPSWTSCAELRRHPESQTQYMGTLSAFYCEGYMFNDVDWLLNGSNALNNSHNTGVEKRQTVSDDTISLELLVPGIEINNGSWIRCYGIKFLPSGIIDRNATMESSAARLLLQGPPDKVINFKGTNTSDTTILLSWEPPYHLPGTTCCSQYYVNITHVDGTVIMDDNITTENMSFTVERERLCDTYIVTIVAYNPAGEGQVFLTQWSLAGFFELDSATHDLYYENTNLLLDVNVTIGGYCLNQVDNATLSTMCPQSHPGSGTSTTNAISAPSTVSTFDTNFEVPLPVEDEICYYEVALENNFAGLRQDISTFDVSSVSIVSILPGEVCLSCQYLRNSLADGCEIEVNNNEFDSDRYRGVLLREERQVCIAVQYGGSFTINIYDINDNGRRSAGPAVVFPDVPIPTPTPTTSPSEPTLMAFTDTGAFAGIVAVLVVVVFCVILVLVVIMVVVLYRSAKNKKSSESIITPTDDHIAFDGRRQTSFIEAAGSGEDVFGSDEVKSRIVDLLSGIERNHTKKYFNIKSSLMDGGIGLRLEITVMSGDC